MYPFVDVIIGVIMKRSSQTMLDGEKWLGITCWRRFKFLLLNTFATSFFKITRSCTYWIQFFVNVNFQWLVLRFIISCVFRLRRCISIVQSLRDWFSTIWRFFSPWSKSLMWVLLIYLSNIIIKVTEYWCNENRFCSSWVKGE